MSLRVWLPLNKDLRNNGLENVTVTNNGATFSNDCANFISDNGINTNVLVPMMEHTTRLSISFWMNPGTFDENEHNLVGTTTWTWLLSYNKSSLIFRQWNSNGSSTSSATDAIQWISGTGIFANSWNFITLTWDGNNCRGYINGSQVFIRTNTNTITHKAITNSSNFWLKLAGGIYKTNTNGFNGSLYDFRIYDHALSIKEVKELAKGLYLHYTFSDPYVENTINLNSANWIGLNSYWKISSQSLSEIKLEKGTDTSNYLALRNESLRGLLSTATTITISGYLYKDDVPYKTTWNGKVSNYNSVTSISYESRDDGYFRYTFKYGSLSDNWMICMPIFGYENSTGQIAYIRNMQWELKDHATPYTPNSRTTTILPDNSGFGNDGIIYGNLSVLTESPRYDNNTNLQGVDGYVYNALTCNRIKSVSFWNLCTTNQSGIIFVHKPSMTAFGWATEKCTISTGASSDARSNTRYTLTGINDNKWHHFVVINDGTRSYLYVDGVSQNTTENSYFSNTTQDLYIGRRSSTSSPSPFIGQISDFRMYTTILSEQDIQNLYKDSFIVDDTQKSYCYELNESDTQSSVDVKKNGLLLCNEYMETPLYMRKMYYDTIENKYLIDRKDYYVYKGKTTTWDGKKCYIWNRYDDGNPAEEVEVEYDEHWEDDLPIDNAEVKILTNTLNIKMPFNASSTEFVASIGQDGEETYNAPRLAVFAELDSNGLYNGMVLLEGDDSQIVRIGKNGKVTSNEIYEI